MKATSQERSLIRRALPGFSIDFDNVRYPIDFDRYADAVISYQGKKVFIEVHNASGGTTAFASLKSRLDNFNPYITSKIKSACAESGEDARILLIVFDDKMFVSGKGLTSREQQIKAYSENGVFSLLSLQTHPPATEMRRFVRLALDSL